MGKMTGRLAAITATLLLALGISARPSYCQVKPGDTITRTNAAQVQSLVSPGTYYAVNRGMQMHIVAPTQIDWPPPYKSATEKYSAQVRLSADHRTVEGY